MKNSLFIFALLLVSKTNGDLCNECIDLDCPKSTCDNLETCIWDLDSNKCTEITSGSGDNSGDDSGDYNTIEPYSNASSSIKIGINFFIFMILFNIFI